MSKENIKSIVSALFYVSGAIYPYSASISGLIFIPTLIAAYLNSVSIYKGFFKAFLTLILSTFMMVIFGKTLGIIIAVVLALIISLKRNAFVIPKSAFESIDLDKFNSLQNDYKNAQEQITLFKNYSRALNIRYEFEMPEENLLLKVNSLVKIANEEYIIWRDLPSVVREKQKDKILEIFELTNNNISNIIETKLVRHQKMSDIRLNSILKLIKKG